MINIRRADFGDIDLLCSLGIRAYRQHFTYLWTETGLEDYLAEAYSPAFFQKTLEDPDTVLWLATYREESCGYLLYHGQKTLPDREEAGAYINRLYLLQEVLGLGIGSRLMNTALQQAGRDKRSYLWLEVMQSNQRSMAFYRRHGFAVHGPTAFTRLPMRHPELAKMWWMVRSVQGS